MHEIIIGNNATDSGEYFDDLRYHFNRKMDEIPIVASIKYWMLLQYQRVEIYYILRKIKNPKATNFTEKFRNRSICRKALETMGRLSHMGQDFYAHAVGYSTTSFTKDFSSISSIRTTITASNPNPGTIPQNSSPDFPFLAKPSNYDGTFLPSEHGSWFSEPGNRASDKSKRIADAEKWTYDTLLPLLTFWKEKCPCYGYDFFYVIEEILSDL